MRQEPETPLARRKLTVPSSLPPARHLPAMKTRCVFKTMLAVLLLLKTAVLNDAQHRGPPSQLWDGEGEACADQDDEQCVAKRQLLGEGMQPLPCFCETVRHLQDLGPLYYPRYLPYVTCKVSSCWIPPYQCLERLYKVHVLKRRGLSLTPEDKRLPSELREDWHFVQHTVVVGCECALQY